MVFTSVTTVEVVVSGIGKVDTVELGKTYCGDKTRGEAAFIRYSDQYLIYVQVQVVKPQMDPETGYPN